MCKINICAFLDLNNIMPYNRIPGDADNVPSQPLKTNTLPIYDSQKYII